jgi:ribosomal-protein-alanine N-acetyltransferase
LLTRLGSERWYIRALAPSDAEAVLALRVDNKDFLEPYEPVRPDSFFTLEAQRSQLEMGEKQWDADLAYAFGIFDAGSDEMVGRVALSNVVWAAWRNATLGYFIAQRFNGKGAATDAVRLACDFAFGQVHLHRVQAGVMPRNVASIRVLEKVGFRHEGFSPRYLNINGKWEDHEMFALTAEEWDEDGGSLS